MSRHLVWRSFGVLTIVGIAVCVLSLGSCSSGEFIERVTIINDTDYSTDVAVRGSELGGWLQLTLVRARSEDFVEDVIDQGDVWIFRFDFNGRYEEQVELSRSELEKSDWSVEVPQSYGDALPEMGFKPPP